LDPQGAQRHSILRGSLGFRGGEKRRKKQTPGGGVQKTWSVSLLAPRMERVGPLVATDRPSADGDFKKKWPKRCKEKERNRGKREVTRNKALYSVFYSKSSFSPERESVLTSFQGRWKWSRAFPRLLAVLGVCLVGRQRGGGGAGGGCTRKGDKRPWFVNI